MLWALRCVAAGRLDCPSLRRAFIDLCGRSADKLLCGLLVLVRLLAAGSEAGLRLHLPGSSVMSRDERAILSALGALREPGGVEAAASHLAAHLGGPGDRRLLGALNYLADLLLGEERAPLRSAQTLH
jgi:hypothetical protein